MSRSRSRGRSRSHSNSGSNHGRIERQTTHVVGLRQQLLHLGRRLGRNVTPSSTGHGSISTILIVNLLVLLLLSLCCDVCCRSHAEPSPSLNLTGNAGAAAAAAAAAAADALSNMRPTLDSDVVEKVAVWTKHVGPAPPSLTEGIAISSMARARAANSNLNTATQYDRRQQQQREEEQQQQKHVQHADEDETGADERILLEQVTRDCVQRCIVEVSLSDMELDWGMAPLTRVSTI